MDLGKSDKKELCQRDLSKSYYDVFGERYPELENQLDNNSEGFANTTNINNFDIKIDTNELTSKINYQDFIEYAIDIVKKTVKCEDTLIKQILYTALSSYIQSDPINLAIIAPTSEGKTYAVEQCIKPFPKQDIIKVGTMSTKALIRLKGILIDSNNQPIEVRLKQLRKQKEETKDKKDKVRIDDQIKALYENSKTLIDLTNKILVFLEPPVTEVWEILKPILSHDSLEIEFPFVNKNERDGLQTKNVVVRGWPACIFCSAKDESKWDVWPEIKSRFLISSPNMIVQKYQESTKLISQFKGLPNLIKEQIIVSEKEIDLAKECILAVKQNIEKLRNNNNKKISIWIPFYKLLQHELPSTKGTDVRFTKRIFSFLNILPIIRHDQRYSLVLDNETSVIAGLEDLKEALYITQNFDGIPKYKKEFFDNVFHPCYKSKTEPDSNADGSKKEEIIAVTTKQLCEFYKKVKGKSINSDILKKTYLNELLNNELVDCESSFINPRQYIYYPLVEPSLFSNAANTNNKDNHNNQDGRASIASKSSHFDKFLHMQSPIYEKITKKIDETWLFYEIMQLISHRIDFEEIKGPLAEYLNNNEKFWIVDNKKSEYNNYSQLRSYLDNKKNPNFIEGKPSIEDSTDGNDMQQTPLCCCNNKLKHYNNNRLTIKHFIQSYTNFSNFDFDAQRRLKWTSFTKTSHNSSKLANFDAIDVTCINSDRQSAFTETKEKTTEYYRQNSDSLTIYEQPKDKNNIDKKDGNSNIETSAGTRISDTSNFTLIDFVNLQDTINDTLDNNGNDNERLSEEIKTHSLIGYREPFYYCKEHPNVENIYRETIEQHILYSVVHKSP